MPDAFDHLVPDARAFLTELAANNSRDWFLAHKSRYEADLKRPAELLLDAVADTLAAKTGIRPATKLFRPNRDLRFSKDKTPYTTHLHMLWSVPDGPGWFFGIGRDYLRLGGGLMALTPAQITAWRAAVAGPAGQELDRLLAEAAAQGWEIGAPELKRVPQGIEADHPRGDLLRRKRLVLWQSLDAHTDLPRRLAERFVQLTPVRDWLIRELA